MIGTLDAVKCRAVCAAFPSREIAVVASGAETGSGSFSVAAVYDRRYNFASDMGAPVYCRQRACSRGLSEREQAR